MKVRKNGKAERRLLPRTVQESKNTHIKGGVGDGCEVSDGGDGGDSGDRNDGRGLAQLEPIYLMDFVRINKKWKQIK